MKNRVCIIGGGPVGSSLGVVLRRRGYDVTIYERYADIRKASVSAGRSINLVLTKRGLRLAHELNLEDELKKFVVKVEGRCIHPLEGDAFSQAYGLSGECNYSINRSLLNRFWVTQADKEGCEFRFEHALQSMTTGPDAKLVFTSPEGEIILAKSKSFDYVFGCDGGGSVVRNCLAKAGLLHSQETPLPSVYKEVVFPANADGSYCLDPNLLHIWPRSGHMLMALANTDGSFTGTVFMDPAVASIDTDSDALQYLQTYYQTALDVLTPAQVDVTVKNLVTYKKGTLGTVRCHPWLVDSVLLLGDAAHGIVPFFGQGVNCGFEDVVVLDKLIAKNSDLEVAMIEFANVRKTDTDAIASLALENFDEMQSHVVDEEFLKLKKIESFIMTTFPLIYRNRYTMVMYSYNPYSVCQAMGEVQKKFLKLVAETVDDLEKDVIEKLIHTHITPVAKQLGVSFSF